MVKNPEQIIDNDLTQIQIKFEQNNPNIILCSKSFHKIEFLNRLINSTEEPVIIVDMDLLYTGYVQSGMIQKKENVMIFYLDKTNWGKKLPEIISKVSKKRFLVIIDSFNGIYNVFDDLESARFINSCMMLLASIGDHARSSILITGIARKKENDEWVLLPGGKRIIKSEKTGIYFLKKRVNDLVINALEKTDINSKIFKIEQEKF